MKRYITRSKQKAWRGHKYSKSKYLSRLGRRSMVRARRRR